MEVKVKEVVCYGGHAIKANGAVDLVFKAKYSEITNSMSVLQMLNNDVDILAKIPGQKAIKLGIFRVKNVIFDDDGESVLKFNSITNNVETDNLNILVPVEGSEEFQILMSTEIDEEEDEDAE